MKIHKLSLFGWLSGTIGRAQTLEQGITKVHRQGIRISWYCVFYVFGVFLWVIVMAIVYECEGNYANGVLI